MVVCYVTQKPHDIWFLDGVCFNHMSERRSFKELDESKKLEVTLGDNKKIPVEDTRTVSITTSKGNTRIL